MQIYVLNFVLILIYGLILRNKKAFVALSAIQLFLILALRDPLLGVDNTVYMAGHEYISTLSFKDMLSRLHFLKTAELIYPYTFESGYVFVSWVVAFLGIGFHGFLILQAAFCIFSVSKFIYKYSENYCLSFVLFIALEFFTYQFGILRQTLALAIFIMSIPLIKEHKLIKYLLLCLIAFTIHRVAIIALPLYFVCNFRLSQKRYMSILIMLLAFLVISPLLVNSISIILLKLVGKNIQMQSINMNAQFLIMMFCAVLILFFSCFEKLIGCNFDNNILLWCFLWAISIEIIGLYNDLLARAIYIPYIAIIALIPNVLENYRNKGIAKIGKIVLVVFAFAFMILQLKDNFINPYVFCFK